MRFQIPTPNGSADQKRRSEMTNARATEAGTSRLAQHPENAMLGRFTRRAVAFLKKEDGPTAVEYAVMLALILVVIMAAVGTIGGTTSAMYNDLSLQGVKPTSGS